MKGRRREREEGEEKKRRGFRWGRRFQSIHVPWLTLYSIQRLIFPPFISSYNISTATRFIANQSDYNPTYNVTPPPLELYKTIWRGIGSPLKSNPYIVNIRRTTCISCATSDLLCVIRWLLVRGKKIWNSQEVANICSHHCWHQHGQARFSPKDPHHPKLTPQKIGYYYNHIKRNYVTWPRPWWPGLDGNH